MFGDFVETLKAFRASKMHGDSRNEVFYKSAVPTRFWRITDSTLNPCTSIAPKPPVKRAGSSACTASSRRRAEEAVGAASVLFDASRRRFNELMFPSAVPTSRDEVVALAGVLDTMLAEVDATPLKTTPPQLPGSSGPTQKVNFQNGSPSVSILAADRRIGVSEEVMDEFKYKEVRDAQRELTSILMIGWMELVRQNFAVNMERGVLLEKLRLAFADLLENAYDMAEYFQKRVEDIEELRVDEKIRMMSSAIEEKDVAITGLHRTIGELEARVAEVTPQLEELERLRAREVVMQAFLRQQLERNAQLVQVGHVLKNNANVSEDRRVSRSTAGRSRRSSMASQNRGSDRPGHAGSAIHSNDSDAGSTAQTSKEADASLEGVSDNDDMDSFAESSDEGQGSDASGCGLLHIERMPMVDCCVQTDLDKRHDDLLYSEVNNMMKHLGTVAEVSDQLVHKVYGQPDVATPSYHCAQAVARLEDLTFKTVAAQEKANAAHGNAQGAVGGGCLESGAAQRSPIPARGALEVTKPFLAALARDVSSTLKQLALRFSALVAHRGLQKALTDPLRPPRGLNEPCQLCQRVGMEPKTLAAVIELQNVNASMQKLQKEYSHVTEDCTDLRKEVHQLKARLASVSGPPKEGVDQLKSVSLAEGHGAASDGRDRRCLTNVDQSRVPTFVVIDASTNTEAAGSETHEALSPPLTLELVINCRCMGEAAAGAAASQVSLLHSTHGRITAVSPEMLDSAAPHGGKIENKQLSRPLTPQRPTTESSAAGTWAAAPQSPRGSVSEARLREERRRMELATGVSRLRSIIAHIAARSNNPEEASKKSLQWTLKLIANVYRSKHTSDMVHLGEGHSTLACQEHLVDFMKQTYGTRRLVDQQSLQFLAALNRHKSDDRVQQFASFLQEEFTTVTYTTFLRLMRVIDEAIGMFDTVNGHSADDEPKYKRIPLECAIYAATQVLRRERPAVFEEAVRCAVELSLEAVPRRTFRSMVAVDEELLSSCDVPPNANVRDVPRAQWLHRVCELLQSCFDGRVQSGADDPSTAGALERRAEPHPSFQQERSRNVDQVSHSASGGNFTFAGLRSESTVLLSQTYVSDAEVRGLSARDESAPQHRPSRAL